MSKIFTLILRESIQNLKCAEAWTEEKYADGFDLVVCWGVLHHTHDPYKGFLALMEFVDDVWPIAFNTICFSKGHAYEIMLQVHIWTL